MEKQKTILIVEDESIVAIDQKNILENEGYRVIDVKDGEKALSVIEEDAVDLVLMDIELGPGKIDGAETAKRITERWGLPVIFCSGHTEQEFIDKVAGIPSYGIIQKNAGEFVLRQSVNMAFALFESHRHIRQEIKDRRKTEEIYRSLIEYCPDGIVMMSMLGVVMSVNRAFLAITGYAEEDFIHKHFTKIPTLITRDLATYKQIFSNLLKRETDGGIDFKWKHSSGEERFGEAQITVVNIKEEEPFFQCIVRDVTEQVETREELEQRKVFFTNIVENIPNMVFLKEAKNLTFYLVNKAAEEVIGLKRNELIGKSDYDVFPQHEADFFREKDLETLEKKEEVIIQEEELSTPGGKRYVYTKKVPILDETGEPQYLLGITEDITELKKALAEKDSLMQEMNHRVKNNLLMISSLISLKNSTLGEDVDLTDLQHQIDAIRIVHEKLYKSEEITSINIKEYIEDLLSTIFSSFTHRQVELELKVADIVLTTKTTIPLGLIINEAATNAIQHGFIPEEKARFAVTLQENTKEGIYVLVLENNGVPFPDSVDIDNPDSLGLQLINALVSQLRGTLEMKRKPKTEITIRFPFERA